MSKVIELTDNEYAALATAAARSGETPQHLLSRMVEALAQTQTTDYYSDDELLRELGADDQELAELAKLEAATDADE